LKNKLDNPNNWIVGFVELLDWFNTTFDTNIKYKTFHGLVVRKFSAKIKVARKVHLKNDEQAVATFKNNFSQVCEEIIAEKKLLSNS